MSDRQALAEHATGLGVVGLATMGMNAAPLIPLAVLAAWGVDRYKSCSQRKQRDIVNRVIKQIEKSNPDHRAVGPALALLQDNRHKVAIPPAILADAEKRGDFPDTLYNIVFAGVEVPKDDGVEVLLRMVMTAAWQELRQEDDYHKVFVQESVTALEHDVANGFARIEAQLATIADDAAATRGMVAELVTREQDRAREFGIKEGMLIALARRYAEGNASDFDAALRGLERALEVASEERARGQLPGNTDAAVTTVIARVDALNEEGQIDDAAALIAAEEARAQAGLIRLYDKGIAQAVLTRDVDAAVGYTLKKLALDMPDEATRFAAMRPVWVAWYERGRDMGLNFDAEVAVALIEASFAHAHEARQHGMAYNDLGLARWTLGQRESGTLRLEQAVAAYRSALDIRDREGAPLDWAMTQNNLGLVLNAIGAREVGTARLEEAVVCYRAALEVYTREHAPLDWAMTQNNLGNVLQSLGARESGTLRLNEAVFAYRAALQEWTRDRMPTKWAMTQNNLGNALQNLGARDGDSVALEGAVTAYRSALQEWTPEHLPLEWATAQNNLGSALQYLGEQETGFARLEEAVVTFNTALKERTRDRVPLDWAGTMSNLGNALLLIGQRDEGNARLEQAIVAYRSALEERQRNRVPLDWAGTSCMLAKAEALSAERTGNRDRAHAALPRAQEAAEVLEAGGHAIWAEGARLIAEEIEAILCRMATPD